MSGDSRSNSDAQTRLMPTEAHSSRGSEYDKAGDFYLRWLDRNVPDRDRRIQASTGIMLAMLGDVEGIRVCDLGCGEGYLSRILASRGALVTGVDISRVLLQHAREHSDGQDITYLLDDAQSLSQLSDAGMDAVICHMALMDIPNLAATLSSVRRILVDHGRFVFTILHPCFYSPFDAENPGEDLDEEGHFKAVRISRYGREGKWYSDGSGMCGTLGSHHRTLSTYFNTLINSGFQLSEISEPLDSAAGPEERRRESVVPTLLIGGATALPS